MKTIKVEKNKVKVLDHGFIKLLNLSGPVRRTEDKPFDADDIDPALTARISFDNFDEERSREQDLHLVEYLIKNRHNTPIEMVEVWMEMKLPIFVARQFVRHRTATENEVSARYSKLSGKWYIPEPEKVGLKSTSNKQGRDMLDFSALSIVEQNKIFTFLTDLEEHNSRGYSFYEHHLEAGIAPELARMFLQVNHYTHWVWKQDMSNLMHFLSLRLHEHAQYEARAYAQAIYDTLKVYLPETMNLFDKHRRM